MLVYLQTMETTTNGNLNALKKAAIFTPLEQVNVTNELLKFQQNKISHSK